MGVSGVRIVPLPGLVPDAGYLLRWGASEHCTGDVIRFQPCSALIAMFNGSCYLQPPKI
jgi:hypothetical protein